MAVLAALSTPNTGNALDTTPRRIVSAIPGVEIDVARFERDDEAATVYLWVRGAPSDQIEAVLRDDPQISDVARLEQTMDGALYRAEWTVDSPLIQCMAATNGAIMQATGTNEEWRLKIWFDESADAATFQQCCLDRNVPLNVDRLKSLGDVGTDGVVTLSSPQREAIELAYRRGYFEQPRRTSQAELADELGISSSAVGGRLRRGFVSLIEQTVVD